ncbi:MAG TPA: DUF3093 domain-containing protein [Pseudonocardiaceae bacterium]
MTDGPPADTPAASAAHAPASTGEPADSRAVFDERLSVPLWWWLPAFGVATLLAAEVHMGYPGVRSWLPYLLLLPLAAAALIMLGRTRVRLASGELWVGRAHVPTRFIGDVETIKAKDKRRVLGPEFDPAAFLMHRAWIGPMLRVRLTDPDDPTPYWIFSVRRPDRLAASLRDEPRLRDES